jgi:hypothetical protein
MLYSNSIDVPVISHSGKIQTATLKPALLSEMPLEWHCDWPNLFRSSNLEFQRIVKLIYKQKLLGLVRYSLYPDLGLLEIDNLEVEPSSQGKKPSRIIRPIGKWLIWYAVQIALRAIPVPTENFIALTAEDRYELIEYYRDTIQMNLLGCKTVAPGEVGSAFSFSPRLAQEFCKKLMEEVGNPYSSF